MQALALFGGALYLLALTILTGRALDKHQNTRRKLSWYAHKRKTRRLETAHSIFGALFLAYSLVSITIIIFKSI